MEWSASATHFAALVTLTVVSAQLTWRLIRNRIERKGYPLPPGPTPLPVWGNVLSVNTDESFKTYTEWKTKYGDIVYHQLFNEDVVVLNSLPVVTELFEKRSQIYSDRPFIPTVTPYGHDSNFSLMPYGEHWRLCSRIFYQSFRADSALSFRPIQLRVARQMILDMMQDPTGYPSHYSRFGAAISLGSVYGYDPSPQNDQMVSIVDDFLNASTSALSIKNAALLGAFPFCESLWIHLRTASLNFVVEVLHIPDWLPGSWIKHEATVARELSVKMVEAPYQYVLKHMESRKDVNLSMVSNHITRMEKFDDSYRLVYEKALKKASSTAFLGSVETTTSSLMTFTLAMVENPHVWKRAQANIDAIVGTGRLPEFDDRLSLPYVEAILRETLRWQPPVPMIMRATTTSDIYGGFYIPKGAKIVANTWAITRDETQFPNAEKFIPERFLDAEGRLTNNIPNFVFGCGRRICPGRYAADGSLWIALATMLAAFDFNPAKDADGMDVTFEMKFVTRLSRQLSTFPCHLTPRPHISKAFIEHALME